MRFPRHPPLSSLMLQKVDLRADALAHFGSPSLSQDLRNGRDRRGDFDQTAAALRGFNQRQRGVHMCRGERLRPGASVRLSHCQRYADAVLLVELLFILTQMCCQLDLSHGFSLISFLEGKRYSFFLFLSEKGTGYNRHTFHNVVKCLPSHY